MLRSSTRRLVADVMAIAQALGGGQAAEFPRHYLEALALFDRCRGIFRAIRVLTEDGLSHEALILTRPLFTESLMLLELASVDERRRVELLVGWRLATLASLDGVFREAQSRGDDATEELAAIAAERGSLEAYARRNDARARHWKPHEKLLADKHRDGDGYLDFLMSHHFVHGTSFASDQRYATRGDTALVGDPSAFDGWADGAALSGAQSMLHAVRGICGVMGWAEPPQVGRLLQRVEELAAARAEATTVQATATPETLEEPAVPMTAPKPENQRAVKLTWGNLDELPLLFSNQVVSQARPLEGIVYLAFGHVSPPPLVGSPEQIQQQVEALEEISIKPLARLAVTPEGLREIIQVLRTGLEKYERGVAEREPGEALSSPAAES